MEWITSHIYKVETEVPDMANFTIGYFVANSANEAARMAKVAEIRSQHTISDFGEAFSGDKEKIENFMQTDFDK